VDGGSNGYKQKHSVDGREFNWSLESGQILRCSLPLAGPGLIVTEEPGISTEGIRAGDVAGQGLGMTMQGSTVTRVCQPLYVSREIHQSHNCNCFAQHSLLSSRHGRAVHRAERDMRDNLSFFLTARPRYFAYLAMGNCFSSSKETITAPGDESRGVNIPPVAASPGPDTGIFAAAQNFTITNSQFIDVHGNYVVCDLCWCEDIHNYVMTFSK